MKLFVGNLSFKTDNESLRDIFGRFGEVEEVKVITDRDTGRSRGFGFVTFSNNEDALAAMEEMNGTSMEGSRLFVNEAREHKPKRGFSHKQY